MVKVFVPPHYRFIKNKSVLVEGYWRESKGQDSILPISAQSSPGAVESVKTVRSRPVPAGSVANSPLEHFTDAGWQAFKENSKRVYLNARRTLPTTADIFKKDDVGYYTAARLSQWRNIFSDITSKVNAIEENREAIICGGLPGAGKTSILKDFTGKFFHLDSDFIKTLMVKYDMVPEIEGLAPLETSHFIHEESTDIMDALLDGLIRKGANLAIDGTMGQGAERFLRTQINEMKNSRYQVYGIFVDVSPQVARSRVDSRYRMDMENFVFNNYGFGGRYIPESILEEKESNQQMPSGVFERLKPLFDEWMVLDNNMSGRAAQVVDKSSNSGVLESLRAVIT